MHHNGAFCLPKANIPLYGLCPCNAVEDASASETAKPRRAHMASFSSSESVIVGNTLPAEVSVPQAPIMKGSDVVFRRLIARWSETKRIHVTTSLFVSVIMNAKTKSIQIPTLYRIEAISIFVIKAVTALIHKRLID